MKCPTADQLAAYFDGVVTNEELHTIKEHVTGCASCQQVLALYEGEEQFLEETLATPTLPDAFNGRVLQQLTPYKKKRSRWKGGLVAASALLAAGIAFSTTPTFATLVQTIFQSEQMDEGIQMALENGAIMPLNLEVPSGNTTLVIEEVLVDTMRIGFTYYVKKGNGSYAEPYFELAQNEGNIMKVVDAAGNELKIGSSSWSRINEKFGVVMFDLPRDFDQNELFVELKLERIGFRNGEWEAKIPYDLTEARKQTQTYTLNKELELHGVDVTVYDFRHTSSLTSLSLSSTLNEAESKRVEEERAALHARYGEPLFGVLETNVSFKIENEAGAVVASSDFHAEHGSISSSGDILPSGVRQYTHQFNPLHKEGNLTLIIDGVYKPTPVEQRFSLQQGEKITVGSTQLTVTGIEATREDKQDVVIAKLVGQSSDMQLASVNWRATTGDETFDLFYNGGSNEQVEGSGIFEHDYEFRIYGLKEVPNDLQFVITEVLDYIPLEEPVTIELMP